MKKQRLKKQKSAGKNVYLNKTLYIMPCVIKKCGILKNVELHKKERMFIFKKKKY